MSSASYQHIPSLVRAEFPDALEEETRHTARGLTMVVDPVHVHEVLRLLRDHAQCACTVLVDLCAVDYPEKLRRFEVVYHLLSLVHNLRVRVKTSTDADAPLPTVCDLFPSANWYEREVWDLYGVSFTDHPDLRRILTDYGFEGHPLRKDFPLTGFVQVRYDPDSAQVVNEPVSLAQDYRSFDFMSPWEGMGSPDTTPDPDSSS